MGAYVQSGEIYAPPQGVNTEYIQASRISSEVQPTSSLETTTQSIQLDTPHEGEYISPTTYSESGTIATTLDFNKDITIKDLVDILGMTIKQDNMNKILTFQAFILTYTEEDQLNIAFHSESSTGKSYIPLEIANYFPKEDVMTLSYTSPTAFFYGSGEWDEVRHLTRIDLSNKIIIFLDQPHDLLLQHMRPILSHDKKVQTIKITNKNKSGRNAQMTAEIIGYPSVVFCSTSPSLDDQERTRLLVLSPEVNQEKMSEAIYLASEKNSNRTSWWNKLETNAQRKQLQARVVEIKKACIKQVFIQKELCEIITKRFFCEHRNLIPRNMRDYQHLTQLIKSWAILNHDNRERKGDAIIARPIDVEIGFQLYSAISESNELGLTPEINEIFKNVVKPTLLNLSEKNELATRRDFSLAYYDYYFKPISPKRLDMILSILDSVGLIESRKDERDRRLNIYSLTSKFPDNS